MTLYYVTGLSGTGKSAVLDELRARGYHARGVDEDGYADWINRITGRRDAFPRDDPGFDFHAWYAAHYWVLSVRRISVLSRAAARLGTPVFLCGSASGDDVVWQQFDKVIALVADEQTIRRRLAARPDGFGTDTRRARRRPVLARGLRDGLPGLRRDDHRRDATPARSGGRGPRRVPPRHRRRQRAPRKPRTSSAITDGYSRGA